MTDPTPYRILVTGSRNWDDEHAIEKVLHNAFITAGSRMDTVLVHGGARGADTIAAALWSRQGLPTDEFPAQWNLYGKTAGYLRNREMVLSGPSACFAFIRDNSPGTSSCIELARHFGIPTYVFEYEGMPTVLLTTV
jgi:hypothetical protein